MYALFKSGLRSAIRAVPPVQRLYRQRNQALVERDHAVAELERERRSSRGQRCFHRGTTEDQARALRLFQLFSPVTLTSAPMIRVGRVGDGGYVMADDYIARVEHLDLPFRYNEQPRYRFFDIGSIIGFYRNSVKDVDPREFMQEGAHLTKQ